MNISFPTAQRFFVLLCSSLALSFFLSTASHADEGEAQRLKQAVIKIYATAAAPDYFTPWRLLNATQSSGSGAVIAGNRILTNAHVVADARYLQVQKNSEPRKYLARVEFVSHEADLALIKVDDPTFFADLQPLAIGPLPEPMQEVSVYGYPFGGNSLSITKGILSRVEHQYYSHSGSFLLAGQIDAAINPGNSGGPVISGGQIVGVVMQANRGGRAENQGYFVPPSMIQHVLKDAEDGVHNGVPDLGFRTQDLDSPAMRAAFKVGGRNDGILITKIFENSIAEGKLQPNDVLLAIGGYKIADDSSIEVRKDLRTNYKYAIDKLHPGELVSLTISRAGEIRTVQLTAQQPLESYSLVQSERFDKLPEYYVYGGVVFVPLNMNLIKRWGRDWANQAPNTFLHARNQWSTPERREIIVALKVLAADVNLGYHNWTNWIVETVNGTPVRDFKHFALMLRNNNEKHVIMADKDGFQMVLDTQQARASEAEILELYQVPSAHSADLFSNDLEGLELRRK